tara:strand:+ start:891 stop:1523 length:633 start_codon:yes stop_codon:yes gene_type:complete
VLDHHAGKLSAKQQAFCREYLVDFNATQAAIRAGYSERSARSIGNENLTKPDIQKYLVALQKPVLEQFEVTQERVIQEIISLAFSNIFDFLYICPETGVVRFDLTKCTRGQAAALSNLDIIEVSPQKMEGNAGETVLKVSQYKIRMYDKLRALECLIRCMGMSKSEKIDVNLRNDLNEISHFERFELAKRIALLLRKAAEGKKNAGEVNN